MATTAQATMNVGDLQYPESDGMPMAESDLHRRVMTDLIQRLEVRYAGRRDVYVSGNLFVYYVENQPAFSLAPDCFVAFGVRAGEKKVYKVWEEGAFPTVVFEITSETTRREDALKKFRIYESTWRVKEAFFFDPTGDYLDPPLVGYRLRKGVLEPIRPVRGRVASKELGITLRAAGTRLIICDLEDKELPLPQEQEAADARSETQKANAERDAALAEVARLKAELDALRGGDRR